MKHKLQKSHIYTLFIVIIFSFSCSNASKVMVYKNYRTPEKKTDDFKVQFYDSRYMLRSFTIYGEIIVVPYKLRSENLIDHIYNLAREYGADGLMDIRIHYTDGRCEEPENIRGSYVLFSPSAHHPEIFWYKAKLFTYSDNATIPLFANQKEEITLNTCFKSYDGESIISLGGNGSIIIEICNNCRKNIQFKKLIIRSINKNIYNPSLNKGIIAMNKTIPSGGKYETELSVNIPEHFSDDNIALEILLYDKNNELMVGPKILAIACR